MEEKIIIAGFGGQGVLSLGQFIAYMAIAEKKEVTWLPSYGPEMRGGTSNCMVVVSQKPVASPIISTPDCLIAMNLPSLIKFKDKVRKGGTIIINSSLIDYSEEIPGVNVIQLPAGELAQKAGSEKAANIAALGAYVKARGKFSAQTAKEVIKERFSAKPKLIDINLAAFEAGYDY
ncbi:MAG: 2-oxoacid:acceptor oxidoreductase family protein [Christensenellales bacterium]|jgi:2-oxoglutarate ferredoxin oxidoreductase subunit gamma